MLVWRHNDSIPWFKIGLRYLHMINLVFYVHNKAGGMNKFAIIVKYGYCIESLDDGF